MYLVSIERRQTPSLEGGESVLLYIERRETPSLHKGESVSLLYREEADESVSSLYIEERDSFYREERIVLKCIGF